MALDHRPRQEGLHLLRTHRPGMAQVKKVHEGPHPMDVSLFRAYAVVKVAQPLKHLIEHALWRWGYGSGSGARLHRSRSS